MMNKREFMELNGVMECPDCEGKGWYWAITGCSYSGSVYEDQERCERCGGSGEVEIETEVARGANEE